ncbi:MAG: NFACT family protein [Lachnospiraceae bacterium]|nr:NFACT family protein [Lachnospiraceae bacterium]
MALDGVTVAALTRELNEKLNDGRILKIAQPEEDELILTVKTREGQERLDICASASLPFVYLTDKSKPSPLTAPGFCMLLRKHLTKGRIVNITQPGLERIIRIEIQHYDELGDIKSKILAVELMGKHSNIIFLDEEEKIIDSIKHIPASVSSVREVLPGRDYFVPNTGDKRELYELDSCEDFVKIAGTGASDISKAIYSKFTGISPVMAAELCNRAGIDADSHTAALDGEEWNRLWSELCKLKDTLTEGDFKPNIVYESGVPVEFAAVYLSEYSDMEYRDFSTVSEMLITYYAEKARAVRIRQHSSELRRIVATALERNSKKYDIQLKQLKDSAKKEKYRIYGELINTYGYDVEQGVKSFKAVNYYNNEEVTVPLDPDIPVRDNAKKYFDRYMKLKRTEEAVSAQIKETKEDMEHLESIQNALDIASDEADLKEIKQELTDCGYIKKRSGKKGDSRFKSEPLHYISSDGYDLYVGKNNYQNDELTFKFAAGNDWWFHSKKFPGSHVILHIGDKAGQEIPDRAFNEAGALAAFYSKGRGQSKVEIDYVQKKEVKKPAGAKPGFVVYYTNYSMAIGADISALRQVEQ